MHRPPAAAVSLPHRPCDSVRDAAGVVNHQGFLSRGRGHPDLVDFLHRAPAQFRQVGGAGNGQQGAFAVHGVSQPRNSVGKAGRGIHTHPQLAGNAPPGVGHVDGRLFVAGVNKAKSAVGHHIQDRQHMVAGQGKDVVDALQLEGLGNQVAAGNAGHFPSCERIELRVELLERLEYGRLWYGWGGASSLPGGRP